MDRIIELTVNDPGLRRMAATHLRLELPTGDRGDRSNADLAREVAGRLDDIITGTPYPALILLARSVVAEQLGGELS